MQISKNNIIIVQRISLLYIRKIFFKQSNLLQRQYFATKINLIILARTYAIEVNISLKFKGLTKRILENQ